MKSEEFEAYKTEIINEILNVQRVSVLNSIKNILNKNARKMKAAEKAHEKEILKKEILKKEVSKKEVIQIIEIPDRPCCYTLEEVKNNIIKELNAYPQKKYVTDDEVKKITLRWSESAFYDLKAIQKFGREYCEKYSINIDSAINALVFNSKSGKKDKNLPEILDQNIRCLNLSKYCKMYYTIMPDCIYIIAMQSC